MSAGAFLLSSLHFSEADLSNRSSRRTRSSPDPPRMAFRRLRPSETNPHSFWGEKFRACSSRGVREANVEGAEGSKILAERQRGSQVDGVQGAQLGSFQGRRGHQDLLVELNEGDASEHCAGPPDRSAADPSRNSLHFDAGHHTGYPLRPRPQEAAESLRLRLGYESLTMAEESRYRSSPAKELEAILAELLQGLGALPTHRSLRRGEVEEVSLGRLRPAGGHQTSERRSGFVDRPQNRHRPAALGHLEALAPSDSTKVPGEVLPELSDA